MFWFQWTVLPLGKHKPTTAVDVVIVPVAVMIQISQRNVVATVIVNATHKPEATGFLVFSQNLAGIGKVAPTADLSVASDFELMLGRASSIGGFLLLSLRRSICTGQVLF